MTVKIHHASVKLGAKHGITFQVVENDVVAYHDGKVLASGATAKIALDKALSKLNGQALVEKAKPTLLQRAKAALTGKRRPADEEDEGLEDADEGDEDLGDGADDAEDESEEDEGASVVKAKYKAAYKPHCQTCGDDLARRVSECVKVQVKVETKSGKKKSVLRIDPAKLVRLAKLNGVWNPDYAKLNVGMQRMNVANRMRKLEKDGTELRWL